MPEAQAQVGEWLTPAAAAQYLGIERTTLWRRAKKGRVAYFQDGDRQPMRFSRTDLDAYLERLRHPAAEGVVTCEANISPESVARAVIDSAEKA